jgi:hypothetical protein
MGLNAAQDRLVYRRRVARDLVAGSRAQVGSLSWSIRQFEQRG